jgi:hypothetical protein
MLFYEIRALGHKGKAGTKRERGHKSQVFVETSSFDQRGLEGFIFVEIILISYWNKN